jgi:cell division control protein 45
MRVPIAKYSLLFNIIQTETLQGSSVLVLVAFDVDALAASRLLKELFTNRAIKSTTVPVAGMADLDSVYNIMVKDNDDIGCIFMINCGGSVDLYEKFHLDQHEDLFIFVADSHRPYHPSNVKNAQSILILDDITATEVSYDMTEEELRSLAKFETSQGQEYNEDSDLDDSDSDLEEDSMDDQEGDGAYMEGEGRRKRGRRRKEQEIGLVAASEESHHGFTASGLIYALALQIGINRKDLLWYSIIGLTDQYIHQRISQGRYKGDLRFFAEKVKNFESASSSSASSSASSATDEFNSHNIVLSPLEYVFMLYRHWNLYDSMFHTRSIAVKLGVWGHHGKKNLEQWLARMGLPLEECKQKYVAMKKKFKDRLPEQLEKYAPEFGVTDLYVESFVKRPSFDKEVSAFDVVYGAAALLGSIRVQHGASGTENGMDVDSEEDFLKANFWNAYRSLSHSNALIDEGIDEAIDLQCAIVRQVTAIIQRRDIVPVGKFRAGFVRSDSPDFKYFTHPLSLSKLAHFLVDTLIDMQRSRKRNRPLMLTTILPSDQCLIVGVEGQHSGAPHVPNRFGRAFAEAAAKTGIPLKYNSFDTSVIQIPKDDLERFREFLHSGFVIQQ